MHIIKQAMVSLDMKKSTYTNFDVENFDKVPRFKVLNYVRLSKRENIFAIGYTPNWSEEVFVIEKS